MLLPSLSRPRHAGAGGAPSDEVSPRQHARRARDRWRARAIRDGGNVSDLKLFRIESGQAREVSSSAAPAPAPPPGQDAREAEQEVNVASD